MKFIALEVGPFFSNCYIFGSETTGDGMIIDPGAETSDILQAVKKLRLNVRYIVATHGHMDHVGALNEVKKAIPGATFAIHQEDAPFLTRRGLMGAFLGTPGPPADMMLHGGETLKAGDLSFKVIHTPGHSPGGICLYGMDTLFSGDTLFRMGIGRYDFPGCSGQALLASIKEKLFLLPDDTVVYPGHGPQTTIGDEKRGNPFLTGAAELD